MQIIKKIKHLFLNACAFGTLISLAFCFFIMATHSLSNPAMTISQYLIILLFGFFIACANLLFTIKSIPKALVYMIHYLALLISFYVIFVLISEAKFPTMGQLFIGFVLFSLIYALVFFFVWLIRRLVLNRIDLSNENKNIENYTPLYR